MNRAAYFHHIRSLGAFPAAGALELAREAAALDEAAAARRAAGPEVVAREVLPDGSAPVHLSFGVNVF